MPEFILDHGTAEASKAFEALDAFTQGYIEAAFWTAHDEGEWSLAMLSPEAMATIIEDCKAFQEGCEEDLTEAYDNGRINGYDDHRAGLDFWLTRNGHGAGFWDRGLGDVGDTLSAMARPYGGRDLYLGDDGKLYLA